MRDCYFAYLQFTANQSANQFSGEITFYKHSLTMANETVLNEKKNNLYHLLSARADCLFTFEHARASQCFISNCVLFAEVHEVSVKLLCSVMTPRLLAT